MQMDSKKIEALKDLINELSTVDQVTKVMSFVSLLEDRNKLWPLCEQAMARITPWEKILDKQTERLKVPGGWIVRSFLASALHQVFVSDPDYTWELPKGN